MTIWLVRAGSHGEHQQKFIQEKKIFVTWSGLDVNLSTLSSKVELIDAMQVRYPNAKPKAILNNSSQIWPFAHAMKTGDLVVIPLKKERCILVGKIAGDYEFHPQGLDPYFHSRTVEWVSDAIPRKNFGQDLLNSFGAFMTICRIAKNNAEQRILAMQANGWKPEKISSITSASKTIPDDADESTQADESVDIEEVAQDQIAKLIEARFKGHSLTRLVDGILRAQGYTTYISPEGADGGADILAGTGPLGFGGPRLCIEVKSESSPIDRPTVDKLIGAVTKFGADEGLFVSWSGYKGTVQKELAKSFFQVRLWSQAELLEQLFANYDKLDEELKAELPLKRIWTVAAQEE